MVTIARTTLTQYASVYVCDKLVAYLGEYCEYCPSLGSKIQAIKAILRNRPDLLVRNKERCKDSVWKCKM